MAVNTRIENNPEGGFSVVFEEDGSGDLNRIIDDLCKKHKEAKESELLQPMDGDTISALMEDGEVIYAIDLDPEVSTAAIKAWIANNPEQHECVIALMNS